MANQSTQAVEMGWLGGVMNTTTKLFARKDTHAYGSVPVGNSVDAEGERRFMPRKVPVKIEPKVYFANERTFLAWMHMSVTIASISIAITAFADQNELSQLYGLLLLPCSIAFCCYSLYIYLTRAQMIRRKDPGPYENKAGPIILSCILGLSIIVNFLVKLYDMRT